MLSNESIDPDQLPALAWFILIARHRSFTKAAAEAGVTRAALSQQLKELEKQLGTRLLYRTTRSMSLTEDGQRLYDTLRPHFRGIARAVSGLAEARGEPAGLLRINTSRPAAALVITPYLGEFLARYPQVSVELLTDDALSDIIAEGCDAGLRLGESLAEHMVAVPVTPPLSMAVVASPAYLDRRGVPTAPQDLMTHACIGYRYAGSGALYEWEFADPVSGREVVVSPTCRFVTGNDQDLIGAALAGVGLAQHFDATVRPLLDDGRLVRVLADWCAPFAGVHLYVPSRDHMPAKVRALIDFLVEKRGAQAATGTQRPGSKQADPHA
jgi:DNA-binding transcriptional LysR family regulator